jgi:hypothetical protein
LTAEKLLARLSFGSDLFQSATEELNMVTEYLNDGSRISGEIDVDRNASMLICAWRPFVGRLPLLIVGDGRKDAVMALVDWYEHVYQEEGFAAAPPLEGLDALVDHLASTPVDQGVWVELAKARWAVRVAEELASWRRVMSSSGPGPVSATDRLEEAMHEAGRQIQGPEGG